MEAAASRERLPDISLRTPAGGPDFLTGIANLAQERGDKTSFRDLHFKPGKLLEIEPVVTFGRQGLVAQLISYTDDMDSVRLEVRATSWNCDWPTYEEYVDTARLVMQPLLTRHNHRAGTRCRLRVQTKRQLEPKLPKRASEALQEFLDITQGRSMSTSDWSLFYDFIWVCRRTRVSLHQDDFEAILNRSGVPEHLRRKLAEVYDHGLRLLWRRRYLYR